MKVNQSYESFVLRECRQQRTPRTLLEAYRDGEYGYTVHLFKDDTAQAWDFAKGMATGLAFVSLFGVVIMGFLTWLGVL